MSDDSATALAVMNLQLADESSPDKDHHTSFSPNDTLIATMASHAIVKSCSRAVASSLPSTPSSARIFLQFAPPQRAIHSTPPILDFLAPSIRQVRAVPKHRRTKNCTAGVRGFATTSFRRQTSAIVNPRTDDDGEAMTVEITPRASNRLKEIMSKDANPNLALRIQVESGGCHGFQYLMSLTTLPALNTATEEAAPALNTSSSDPNAMPSKSPSSSPFGGDVKEGELGEDDTVFATDDGSGAKVVMDGPSLELLRNSKIDYTMELIGSQFKIVDNPLATSSCGCGTSFDIKM